MHAFNAASGDQTTSHGYGREVETWTIGVRLTFCALISPPQLPQNGPDSAKAYECLAIRRRVKSGWISRNWHDSCYLLCTGVYI